MTFSSRTCFSSHHTVIRGKHYFHPLDKGKVTATNDHKMISFTSVSNFVYPSTLSKITKQQIRSCNTYLRFYSFHIHIRTSTNVMDPPAHGQIGGHYFHTWCPSVCQSRKQKKVKL